MSNISPYHSSVSGYDNRGDLERFSSRTSEKREALQASENKSLELSLTTKEGDIVTLSTDSFMDFASLSYDKSGRVSNDYETASARVSSREMTLTSGSQFTFSVQGSLSEGELDDIENIMKKLDEVMYEMSTGDIDEAMANALEMGEGYDTVSGFSADLNYSSSYRYEKEIARQEYYGGLDDTADFGQALDASRVHRNRGVADEAGEALADLQENASTRLLDMMLKEFEKMEERNQSIPGWAAEPVDQLLANHMDQLETMMEKGEKSKGGGHDNIFNELAHARKGMKGEFRKMMSDMPPFFKV